MLINISFLIDVLVHTYFVGTAGVSIWV